MENCKSYPAYWKRCLDVVVAVSAIFALMPLLVGVAVAILLEDGGPVLFRQVRIGRAGRRFTILKFRSMAANCPDLPSHLAGQLRVTRVGRILRRTNLDECPQLFNILRGEMSLVGPRPALPQQITLWCLREAGGANRCRPGLTGLAQVNSYNSMPEDVKARWDNRYAECVTWLQDFRIVLQTFSYLRHQPPTY
jgi:O-antigen biosynthesis protein WbqP